MKMLLWCADKALKMIQLWNIIFIFKSFFLYLFSSAKELLLTISSAILDDHVMEVVFLATLLQLIQFNFNDLNKIKNEFVR